MNLVREDTFYDDAYSPLHTAQILPIPSDICYMCTMWRTISNYWPFPFTRKLGI